MSIDTKAMDYADDTFIRSMRALNSMELADLPPELDQDARDLARIIQEHGPGYADTEHGDMTAPLLESLARLEYAELDDATKGHLRWDARAALRAMGYEVADGL